MTKRPPHPRKSRTAEIPTSGSGEGPGWVNGLGYSTDGNPKQRTCCSKCAPGRSLAHCAKHFNAGGRRWYQSQPPVCRSPRNAVVFDVSCHTHMGPYIRSLEISDAAALFELRRHALRDAPSAFLASPEDDLGSSEDAVRQLLGRAPESVVFGAWNQTLVGMLGFNRSSQIKSAHKAQLWGMFVIPSFRGRGLGEELLLAAIAHARVSDGITSMQLCVSESATSAKRLYERLGFRTWGVEPDAIRYQGQSFADHHMALSLTFSST
jgi:ribosomal protein S18 acetylase RimI-like enzyme